MERTKEFQISEWSVEGAEEDWVVVATIDAEDLEDAFERADITETGRYMVKVQGRAPAFYRLEVGGVLRAIEGGTLRVADAL